MATVKLNADDSLRGGEQERPSPRMAVEIKNYGRTPALMDYIGAEVRHSVDENTPVSRRPFSHVLAAGESTVEQAPYRWPYSPGIAAQIRKGDVQLWVAVLVIYRDVFGVRFESRSDWLYRHDLGTFNAPKGQHDRRLDETDHGAASDGNDGGAPLVVTAT